MKRKRITAEMKEPKERATPERLAKAGSDMHEDARGVQRLSDAPLDSLRKREIITAEQFEAGDEYRQDCWRAGMISYSMSDPTRVHSGYGSRLPGFLSSEARAQAMDRVIAKNMAMGEKLVVKVQPVLLALAGDKLQDIGRKVLGRKDGGEARAAIVELTLLALDILAALNAPKGNVKSRSWRSEQFHVNEEYHEKSA